MRERTIHLFLFRSLTHRGRLCEAGKAGIGSLVMELMRPSPPEKSICRRQRIFASSTEAEPTVLEEYVIPREGSCSTIDSQKGHLNWVMIETSTRRQLCCVSDRVTSTTRLCQQRVGTTRTLKYS